LLLRLLLRLLLLLLMMLPRLLQSSAAITALGALDGL
jgi:hypothetical protein